jgi:type IV pilus assembly protein PilE
MERFYTTNLRYDKTTAGVDVVLASPACRTDIAAVYVLSFVANEPAQSTYALQAAPQGGQATADAGCGTLTLTHTGKKDISGTKAVNQCWQ